MSGRKDVTIRGFLNSWMGYGQLMIEVGKALESVGMTVEFDPFGVDQTYEQLPEWASQRIGEPTAPVTLQVLVPHQPAPRGRKTVALTMWETDTINAKAVKAMNGMAHVVVPSTACLVDFTCSGVTAPITRVPLGIDARLWRPMRWRPDDGVCVFGASGRLAHGGARKGLDELCHAFTLAFPPGRKDVRLELKVWPDDIPKMQVPDDPRIRLHTAAWPQKMLASWLASLDCYVCPSKGEGWGFITQQAMAVGRPVVACQHTGTAEFWIPPDHGWKVKFTKEDAGGLYRNQGKWRAPNVPSLVRALRSCVRAGREERQRRGAAASEWASGYTWDRTAHALAPILAEVGGLAWPLAS
jgi:glycosyltransferase involved in cell wall biosynthesis